MRKKIQISRARARRHVWSLLEAAGGVPASKVTDTDLDKTIVLDVDAIVQIPGPHRKHLLVRSDGAGSSHALWSGW